MRLLILGAFEMELEEILPLFPELKETMISKRRCLVTTCKDYKVALSLTGIGSTAAGCTTTALCETYKPDLIIMCGVAGGLDADQAIGDLVLANKIIDADLHPVLAILPDSPYKQCLTEPHTKETLKSEYTIHPSLVKIGTQLSVERLKAGTIITSNVFPAPAYLFGESKKIVGNAIEMEGAAVLKAASHYEIPVLVIRAVSNLIDSTGTDLGTVPSNLKVCAERLAFFLTHLLEKAAELKHIVNQGQQGQIKQLIQNIIEPNGSHIAQRL